jgi:pyruvate formate lyase activating enzyme
MNGKVDYEFRTTAVKGLHDENSMKSLAKWIAGAKRYYIQNFVDSGELIGKAEGLSLTEMRKLLETARKYVPSAELRGL